MKNIQDSEDCCDTAGISVFSLMFLKEFIPKAKSKNINFPLENFQAPCMRLSKILALQAYFTAPVLLHNYKFSRDSK